jgi:membrane associated rhomboid family serine protease/Flp pilus assembly protein TadD
MSNAVVGREKPSGLAQALAPTHKPVLLGAILGLNGVIFLLEVLTGGSTNTLNLIRFGAQYGPSVEAGEYWRFITAAFLHIGLIHLLVNSFCLWELGRPLEHLYGTAQFGFTYLLSGAAGSLFSFLAHELIAPRTVSAGASGAIFGVAGAMAIAGWRFEHLVPENFKKVFGIGVVPFIAFNLYYGFTHTGIDNFAHLGGVMAGVGCGLILNPQEEKPRDAHLAAGGFLLLVLIAFGVQYRTVRGYDRTLRTAAEMLDAGKLPEAEMALADILKRGALDPSVHTLAGLINVRRGRVSEGISEIREALRIAPGYAPARRALGGIFVLQGNLAAAASQYREAIRLEPTSAVTHLSLAGILSLQQKYDEAAEEFRTALRLDPRLAAAHYGLGVILALQQKPEAAAEEFRATLKINPQFTAARHAVAALLLKQARYDEAISELKETLRLNPQDVWAQKTLAVVGKMKGETPVPATNSAAPLVSRAPGSSQ